MLSKIRPFLIIDFYNLARPVFAVPPKQKVTPQQIRRLLAALNQYAQAHQVRIEVCIDPTAAEVLTEKTPALGIRIAAAGEKADDLILQWADYAIAAARPCLVVSDDNDLQEQIAAFGAAFVRVTDFVRLGGNYPIFQDPRALPSASLPRGQWRSMIRQRRERIRTQTIRVRVTTLGQKQARRPKALKPVRPHFLMPIPNPPKPMSPQAPPPKPPRFAPQKPAPQHEIAPPSASKPINEPVYRIDWARWSPEEGVRFLLGAFCGQHAGIANQLAQSNLARNPTPENLRQLGGTLWRTCGTEAGFIHGCLIDRVRLALLAAGERGLSHRELLAKAQLGGAGIARKLRKKSDGWIEIIDRQ